MNVKGFILEDDRGQEFVMAYERHPNKLGQLFQLRGWQRRRLVPLRYSEREGRRIIGEVLMALDDLFTNVLSMARHRGAETPFSETSSVRQPLVLETAPRGRG